MNSTIGGNLCCSNCKTNLAVSFEHTMEDKHLDELTESIEIYEND